AAEGREEAGGRRVARGGGEEIDERRLGVAPDGEDAEAVPVRERIVRIRPRQLVPQTPDSEALLPDVRVVEQDHPPWAERREPGPDIVGDRLVLVTAVDVEQVDRGVGETRGGLVERLLQQLRKAGVQRIVMRAELLERLGPVRTGVAVAAPRVDGVT